LEFIKYKQIKKWPKAYTTVDTYTAGAADEGSLEQKASDYWKLLLLKRSCCCCCFGGDGDETEKRWWKRRRRNGRGRQLRRE
jgi:hypothetical protein